MLMGLVALAQIIAEDARTELANAAGIIILLLMGAALNVTPGAMAVLGLKTVKIALVDII